MTRHSKKLDAPDLKLGQPPVLNCQKIFNNVKQISKQQPFTMVAMDRSYDKSVCSEIAQLTGCREEQMQAVIFSNCS